MVERSDILLGTVHCTVHLSICLNALISQLVSLSVYSNAITRLAEFFLFRLPTLHPSFLFFLYLPFSFLSSFRSFAYVLFILQYAIYEIYRNSVLYLSNKRLSILSLLNTVYYLTYLRLHCAAFCHIFPSLCCFFALIMFSRKNNSAGQAKSYPPSPPSSTNLVTSTLSV